VKATSAQVRDWSRHSLVAGEIFFSAMPPSKWLPLIWHRHFATAAEHEIGDADRGPALVVRLLRHRTNGRANDMVVLCP
jgi:hypothetical protein